MRNETKVKYLKKDKVHITMSVQGYANICKYFNSFSYHFLFSKTY